MPTVNMHDAKTRLSQLVAAVRSRAPGEKITLTYLDSTGASQTVQVTLGKAQQ